MGNILYSNNNHLLDEINEKNIEIEKYQKKYYDLNLDYIQQSIDYDKATYELKYVLDENESKKKLEDENKENKIKLLSESIKVLEEEKVHINNELKDLQTEFDIILEENARLINEINWKKSDLNNDFRNEEE